MVTPQDGALAQKNAPAEPQPPEPHELLFSPWMETFLARVRAAQSSITLVCPFVKLSVVKKIVAALPPERRLNLELISRFDRQVFDQHSSDVDAFLVLQGLVSRTHNVRIYVRSKLHAKIFVFDGKDYYITSSNLTHHGLNVNFEVAVRLPDPTRVLAGIAPLRDPVRLLELDDILQMRTALQIRAQEKMSAADFSSVLEPEMSPEGSVGAAITDDNQEPSEPPIVGQDIERQVSALAEINAFLRDLGPTAAHNTLEGVPFQSPQKPSIDRATIASEVIAEFDDYWGAAATNDRSRLDLYLRTHLQQLFSPAPTILAEILPLFVHRSWQNNFAPDLLSDRGPEVLELVGDHALAFYHCQSLLSERLLGEERSREYVLKLEYLRANYPYSEVLDSLGLRILLHMGDLPRDIDRAQLHRFVGFAWRHLEERRFRALFDALLDRTTLLVYDDFASFDYKSLLQELSLDVVHRPPRYVAKQPDGPCHAPIHWVDVDVGGELLATASGHSIHEAELAAAAQAVSVLSQRGWTPVRRPPQPVRSYSLAFERRSSLAPLSRALGLDQDAAVLLDIALTHPSLVHVQPSSRSWRKLSLLGAHLVQLLASDALPTAAQAVRTFPPEQLLSIYERYQLGSHVRAAPNQDMPPSNKRDAVKALLAAVYLNRGIGNVRRLLEETGATLTPGTLSCTDSPISEVQRRVLSVTRTASGPSPVQYRTLTAVQGHQSHFEIALLVHGIEFGRGAGATKQEAKRIAAVAVLKNQDFAARFPPTNGSNP